VAAGGLLAAAFASYRRSGDERALFVGAILGSLVITPVLWSHYFVLLAAGALVFDAPRRWLAVVAIASWAIAPPHNLDLHPPVVRGLVTTSAWLLAATVLAYYGYEAWRRRVRPPGLLE
jgi:hypothetical protein